jgi:hypothetical protein
MKKVITLLSVLVLALATAAPALAQGGVNLQQDAGDNYSGGQVVGDDTPDCATAADVMESGLCAPGSSLNEDPSTLTDVASASASADPCPDPDFPRSTPDGCQASNLADVASASASAPSGSQYQYSTPAESQYSAPAGELPPTGGFPWLLFVGVGTLIGGIILASRLYLSHRLSTR